MLSYRSVSTSVNQLKSLAYLDRVKKLYPYGVSASSIVISSDVAIPVKQATVRALLVVCDEARSEYETLLGAICSKGLQLTSNEYFVRYLGAVSFSEGILADLSEAHSPLTAVVFGAGGKPGATSASGSTRVLFAESLGRIAIDLAIKKEFWRQLQESIVPLLKAR